MNWGNKLALGLGIFMLFIICMVAYMFTKQGNDALVDDDYYEKGLNYNEDYTLQQNVLKDQATPTFNQTQTQLIFKLKDSAQYTLNMMCMAKAKSDRKLVGITLGKENLIIIPTLRLEKGRWALALNWSTKTNKYLFKKEIIIP